MNDDATIGKNLATLRAAASLTQGDLAERIGVAQQTIAKIEKGTRPLKYSEAVAACAALHCPVSALSDDGSEIESTAMLLRTTDQLVNAQTEIESVARLTANDLVALAGLVMAIRSGDQAQPADWDYQQMRAMEFIQTDWGAEVLNSELTRGVKQRLFGLGVLSKVDGDSYLEILANMSNWKPDAAQGDPSASGA